MTIRGGEMVEPGAHKSSLAGIAAAGPRVAIEAFAVHLAAHSLGGMVVQPFLMTLLPSVPGLTLGILAKSATAPTVAVLYCIARGLALPPLGRPADARWAVLGCGLCIAVAWLAARVMPADLYIRLIHVLKSPWSSVTMLVTTLWVPIAEELLYRGLIFEVLRRQYGTGRGLAVSTGLFLVPHAIWGGIGLNLLVIALYSVLFTLVYLRAGLGSAMLAHALVVATTYAAQVPATVPRP